MLMAKEKLEDMEWLAELLGMYQRNLHHPDLHELATEIKRVRHKIATHDYTPLEDRRQASIKRLGKDSAYY